MLRLFVEPALEMQYRGYGKGPEVCNKSLPKAVEQLDQLDLLKQAELPTLGQRRALASLYHLFKINSELLRRHT